jgi:pyridoxine 5-phosphate synthase
VPEKRQEVTTEGGLDAAGAGSALREAVAALGAAGCRVSLFIDPEPAQLDAARAAGAPVVELHTGTYCEVAAGAARQRELERLRTAARHAATIGLECHAGHGLSYGNVRPVAAIPEIVELNIGHFLVGEAVAIGLPEAIRRMRELMDAGRRDLARPAR